MEMKLDFDTTQFMTRFSSIDRSAQNAAREALEDCTLELERIASEITPIDKGTLSRSSTRKIKRSGENIIGEVEFAVHEGGYNYAIFMHEGVYNHGAGTIARGGTTGKSGKYYYAGRKFLERPLKGEAESFFEYIAQKVEAAVGG